MQERKDEPIEMGNPANDARMFRRCLGQFGTGIAIITTQKDGHRAGVTVNSVASVSLDPPLVLWSISRTSRSLPLFRGAAGFAINVLSKDQIDLSRHFSSSVEDKFQGIPTRCGRLEIPLLEGAVSHVECTVEAAYEGGDHVILVGRVVHVSRYSEEPLLFVQGRYAVAADHPDAPDTNGATAAFVPPQEPGGNLIPLLFETHHALSAKFEDHRRAEGMGPVPARTLAALEGGVTLSVETVARKTYVGLRDAEDTLAELVSKGQVEHIGSGGFRLSAAGRERREAIKRRWLDFQSAETADIPLTALTAASVALTKLLANARPDDDALMR
jgi:4-hydroxyphenylacetate 3-hydroxylase, reductase component